MDRHRYVGSGTLLTVTPGRAQPAVHLPGTATQQASGPDALPEQEDPKVKALLVRDFPGGPVLKTLCFTAGSMGSIPGHGTKIPNAVQCSQKQ